MLFHDTPQANEPYYDKQKNSQNCFQLWGPFLESPGNFTGPKSNIQIEI